MDCKDEMVFNNIEIHNTIAGFVVGYSYNALPEYHIDNNCAFSKASLEIFLGGHYQKIALELSATENISNMDNAIEILFSVCCFCPETITNMTRKDA